MGDMDTRDELLRSVRRRLADGRFASRFTLVNKDGSRPIVVALREDSIKELSERVVLAGGAANVVAPLLDGHVVFSMSLAAPEHFEDPSIEKAELDAAVCTVGVLVQRLIGQPAGKGVYAVVESTHREALATDARVLQSA